MPIDSESADNIFLNPDLITNIQSSTDDEISRMYSFGSYLYNTWEEKFELFDFRLNPASLANILWLSLVKENYWVTFNSWIDNFLIIHISPSHVMKFICWKKGFYYFDTSSVNLYQLRNVFRERNALGEDMKQ